MHCFYPVKVRLPTNGFGISERIEVPCGKCESCLTTRRNQWAFRLSREREQNDMSLFLTLTYDDEKVPCINYPNIKASLPPFEHEEYEKSYPDDLFQVLVKRDVQLFLKRLRKRLDKYDVKLRYFFVGEYGGNSYRPHYHAILFFKFNSGEPIGLDTKQSVIDSWDKGFIRLGDCSDARIMYACKYCLTNILLTPIFQNKFWKISNKVFRGTVNPQPFILSSRKPGLGLNYLTPQTLDYLREHCVPYIIRENGVKVSMPRYYRDKVFDDEMKEIIRENVEKHHEEIDAEFVKNNSPFKSSFDNCNYQSSIQETIKRDYKRRFLANIKKLKI